jgi:hypothetical protein
VVAVHERRDLAQPLRPEEQYQRPRQPSGGARDTVGRTCVCALGWQGPADRSGVPAARLNARSARARSFAPPSFQAAPFVVRVALNDPAFAQRLPAGSTGVAAIFTERVKMAHVIRKVLLRQTAIMNYVLPF